MQVFAQHRTLLKDHVVQLIPKEVAANYNVLLLWADSKSLRIALADPQNAPALQYLKDQFQNPHITICPTSKADIHQAIQYYYGPSISLEILGNTLAQSIQDGTTGPVIRLVNDILLDAIDQRASDIHLEPQADCLRIRYRIDGRLVEKIRFPIGIWSSMGVRLKVITNLNLGDSFKPQTGRFSLCIEDREVDFRLSIHPILQGENMVIRILDRTQGLLPLDQLGFPRALLQTFLKALQRPEGLFIMTGPTGSGKTTTLYSVLQHINSAELNVMTLEQPIEYQLPNIRQTEIREDVGMTFADGVRSILRQDPDVILIGEVRDNDTAAMAMRAAMTGHRVFTTLHTNDAHGVLERMEDLGVAPNTLSSNLVAVLAQRLVRRLCDHCKSPHLPSLAEQEVLKISQDSILYKAKGCAACRHTGYHKRLPLIELVVFEGKIPLSQNRKAGLWAHAKDRILAGETTLAEALEAVHEPL
jgi:type II secretory ATPase GspE/PulE/Tfp pilus assembly ATPase PilB-like protein